MSTADTFRNKAISDFTIESWTPEAYRFHVALVTESNGRVSTIALNLPGLASDGENEEEALANFAEAASLIIESYLEDSEEIPWTEPKSSDIPANAKCQWIFVDG